MQPLTDALSRSPAWFPHKLDLSNDAVSFVRLERRDYERASFLDDRLLGPLIQAQSMPWREVAAAVAVARLEERCGFIFHIGHVGSTLLSRLTGAHPGVFSLREPQLLRGFAQLKSESLLQPPPWKDGSWPARLGDSLKLLSRTFEARQLAVIKATSFVSELASDLLSRPAAPKALLMYVSAESYLATIMGGPNSRRETAVLLPSRLRRLHARIGSEPWRVQSLSEGESVALGWACEMSALAHAARVAGERTLCLDFDAFLRDPAAWLPSVLRHFDIEASAAQVQAILGGPDMQRYSKAPEYAYDAALRYAVLQQAWTEHGAEIRRGLDWLERAATHAPIRAAIELAAARQVPR
jgi:hypothetical protein